MSGWTIFLVIFGLGLSAKFVFVDLPRARSNWREMQERLRRERRP